MVHSIDFALQCVSTLVREDRKSNLIQEQGKDDFFKRMYALAIGVQTEGRGR